MLKMRRKAMKLYLNVCFESHHTLHLPFTTVQFFCGIIRFAEQHSMQCYSTGNVR